MRVALIAPPWIPIPPPGYGGTEAVVDQLARGLARRGHDVLLAAHHDSTCPVPVVTPESVERSKIGDVDEEAAFAAAAARVVAIWKPDVVHDHTVGGSLLPDTVPGAARVHTMHGPFDARLGPMYQRIAHHNSVVAISRSQASLAVDTPVAAVIHHGVDPGAFEVGHGEGGFVVHLGRMAHDKGIDLAIRAAREAGLRLVIASKMRDAGELAYFHEVIEPMLGRGVEFIGEARGVDKLRLLGSATALLNPIRWPEPFGMVMIEAMACGTPVITTRSGAAPEIVDDRHTGYLCRSMVDLVEALGKVGEIDRSTCRHRVERCFSTTRMVDRHLALYRALVDSKVGDPERDRASRRSDSLCDAST